MAEDVQDAGPEERRSYASPSFELIPLGCEISAYAPDDEPLL